MFSSVIHIYQSVIAKQPVLASILQGLTGQIAAQLITRSVVTKQCNLNSFVLKLKRADAAAMLTALFEYRKQCEESSWFDGISSFAYYSKQELFLLFLVFGNRVTLHWFCSLFLACHGFLTQNVNIWLFLRKPMVKASQSVFVIVDVWIHMSNHKIDGKGEMFKCFILV